MIEYEIGDRGDREGQVYMGSVYIFRKCHGLGERNLLEEPIGYPIASVRDDEMSTGKLDELDL